MSHEIRTPLNALSGFSSILTEESIDNETRKQCSDIIQQNSELLLKLINDVIDLSSLEVGKMKFKYERCDAVAICRNVIDMVEKIKQTNANVRFSTSLHSLELTTDNARLQQLLINLLINATKFTPQGSITMELEKQTEDDFFCYIHDDGSTDQTMHILKKWVEDHPYHFMILEGQAQGSAKDNFFWMLAQVESDYYMFADQDDVWMNNKVSTVMPYFNSGNGVVVHDARVMNENLTEVIYESFFKYRGYGGGFLKNLIKNRYIGCCMAFKSDLINKCVPIPRNIQMHDQWIGMMGDIYYGKTCFIDKQLLIYRRHSANNSDFNHNGIIRMIRNRLVLLNEFRKSFMKKDNYGRKKKK